MQDTTSYLDQQHWTETKRKNNLHFVLIYDLPLAIIKPMCSFVDKYTSDKGTFLNGVGPP